MNVVVDASTVVAALVDTGSHGLWAEGILGSASLHAPELIRVEATNVLRRLELSKAMSTSDATRAHADLMQIPLDLFPFAPFAERVWELRHSVTSYDSWYVAVAEALNIPLATLDVRLTRSNQALCRFLTP